MKIWKIYKVFNFKSLGTKLLERLQQQVYSMEWY